MKERPILFNAEMVRAVLDGQKTQTRRVIKPQPTGRIINEGGRWKDIFRGSGGLWDCRYPGCPYGDVGDRLWVRETHCWADYICDGFRREDPCIVGYKANLEARACMDSGPLEPMDTFAWNWGHESIKWRPSIHMPRWASRILLEVTDVRVERVKDIIPNEVRAEGVTDGPEGLLGRWVDLWDSINADRGFGWDVDPWVWVVEFKVVEGGDA